MAKTISKPKRQVAIKFILLLVVIVGYFGYLSFEYDLRTSGVASALTWSFFVLCTPVADAGFLLDFPLRMLFGIRMILSEIAVWGIAIVINIATLLIAPEYYQTTVLTDLMYRIMTEPYPYWGVVVLSGIGTFLSIRFGDELMDVLSHSDRSIFHRHGFKYELLLIAFLLFVIFCYYKLMASLGITI